MMRINSPGRTNPEIANDHRDQISQFLLDLKDIKKSKDFLEDRLAIRPITRMETSLRWNARAEFT